MESSRFLAACASAQAPRSGPVTRIAAYESDNAAVQANVAQGAFSATTETKYAPNTAVTTTVVYAELAKSYMLHAQTSTSLTSPASARLMQRPPADRLPFGVN